jgi:hypothetical protein
MGSKVQMLLDLNLNFPVLHFSFRKKVSPVQETNGITLISLQYPVARPLDFPLKQLINMHFQKICRKDVKFFIAGLQTSFSIASCNISKRNSHRKSTGATVLYTGERVCDAALIRCTFSSGNPRRVGNLVGRVQGGNGGQRG